MNMKYSILIATLLFGVASVGAQTIRVPMRATWTTDKVQSMVFTFGADATATDSVDAQFAEIEIPDLPLPGDVFNVWTIAPLTPPIWMSPVDVRPLPANSEQPVEFDVRVNWNGGTLAFTWDDQLPAGVDSVYVTDGFSDFPNNIQAVKVVPGASFQTNNPAIDRFKVLMWVNSSLVSVDEFTSTTRINVAPNPATDDVTFSGLSGITNEICIVDMTGRQVECHSTESDTIRMQIAHLPAGMYWVHITGDTHRYTLPLVRL